MTTRIWHSIRHIAKIFTFHSLPSTVLSKCYPPPVSVHHPVEERVETVVEAGEGPEQLLEPEVELLGAGLVRPPPDGHDVVRGPAQREPQHQHAHDLHCLHLHRELLNFDISSFFDQLLTFARPMTPELTQEFRMVRFNLLDRLSDIYVLFNFR